MQLRSGYNHGSHAIQVRCEEAKAIYGKANQDRIRVKPTATGQGVHILFDRELSLVSWDSDSNSGLSSSNDNLSSSGKTSRKSSTRSSTGPFTRSSAGLSARSSNSSGEAPQTPRNRSPYQPASVLRTPRKLKRQERIGGESGVTDPTLSSSLVSDGTIGVAPAQVTDRRHLPAGDTASVEADMNSGGRVVIQRMERKGPSGTLVVDEFMDRREFNTTGYVMNARGKMQTIPETFV